MACSRTFLLVMLLTAFGMQLDAQDFSVPRNYTLDTREDYERLQPWILKCIEYLESAPFDKRLDRRKEANAFLVKWLTGSPTVSITLLPYVMELTAINKDFLIIYMGGWTRHVLENPDSTNEIDCHLAAVGAVLRVYQENETVKKNTALDALVDLEHDGRLEAWVRKNAGFE
jgi:hypothetical protein